MPTTPTHNLRQFSRIPFAAQVLLHVHDRTLRVHLVDLAFKGALVRTDAPHALVLQEECRLELPLADGGEGVLMEGNIVHLDAQHIGLACQSIDITSLTRLRRLIELNTGDTTLMQRELLQLFAVR